VRKEDLKPLLIYPLCVEEERFQERYVLILFLVCAALKHLRSRRTMPSAAASLIGSVMLFLAIFP
jgi:hypothetical protein